MLAPLLASLAMLGAQAQAQAPEPVCHGQLSAAGKEQAALEQYASRRALFGFRSDLEYVRELVRQWPPNSFPYSFPATADEQRYLRLRELLAGPELPVHRYLTRRPGVNAGVTVVDGWPGEPYILVRLTRDRAAHEANLRRLTRYPEYLRTGDARYSVRQLRRIVARVGRDFDELKAAGFVYSAPETHLASNSVRVRLVTRRTDHAEYFAQRYGPATTEIIATEPTSLACAEADRYETSATGRSLVLHYMGRQDGKPERVELAEYGDRVEVGAVERVSFGGPYEERTAARRRVALSAPLGERAVIDAATGLRLRQRGPSPGEPPCPVERPLDTLIAERRAQGLPHGRALVRRRLRRGVKYTRTERRYLDVLDEFFFDTRVGDYIRRHGDEYGGEEYVRRFPEGPFKVHYFTRRVAFHRANLERLTRFPRRLRVRRAEHTIAEIEAIRSRVQEEADANRGFLDGWGDAGFFVRFAAALPDRVLVYVITTRSDHAAYFRGRYGATVESRLSGTRHECFD